MAKTRAQIAADYRARHPDRVKASRIAGKERDAAWREANRERVRELARQSYARHKEAIQERRRAKIDPVKQKERAAADYKKHKARRLESGRAWRAANPERCAELHREWIEKNKDRHLARYAEYESVKRAVVKSATPKWANKFFIGEIYDLARRRTKCMSGGEKWSVDHIVPLQSDLVCGLHVEHNLAVIPRSENIRKSNRYWPDMPERI